LGVELESLGAFVPELAPLLELLSLPVPPLGAFVSVPVAAPVLVPVLVPGAPLDGAFVLLS
jgi:hypothetical protein